VEALDTAARLKPRDALAAYNSGTAHLGAGLGDAEPILERALANAPRELAADTHFNLGNARLAAQNATGAIDAFKETLRRAPGHAGARRNLELAQRLLEQQKKQQQQQQNPNQDPSSGGDGQQDQPQQQPEPGDPNEQQPPQDGDPGEAQPPEKPQDGDGQPQGSGSQRQNPLPQFEDQEDMTAEQAAAILQAVDNLEREKRRDEAKQRALAKSNVEKDW
jgi:Ca-activated chloride channel family protein